MSSETNSPNRQLTVAVIGDAAGRGLSDTLDGAAPLADELVVLVDHSLADGPAVPFTQSATRIDVDAIHDFSAARNACLQRAQGDWVLWLEPGETLSPEDVRQLRTFVRHSAEPGRVYRMTICTPPCREAEYGNRIDQVRLAPRRDDLRFAGRVRESLDESIGRLELQIEHLPWIVQRPIDDGDTAHRRLVARRQLRIAEAQWREAPRSAGALLAIAEAQADLGEVSAAAAAYHKAIAVAESDSDEMLQAYYGLLTSLDDEPTESDTQLMVCLEALERYPMDAQLLCAMGGYMLERERWDMAIRSYELAMRHGRSRDGVWRPCGLRHIAASCCAAACQAAGEARRAIETLRDAVAGAQAPERLRRQLIALYIAQNRAAEALAEGDRLTAERRAPERLRTAIRGACLAAAGNLLAAEQYLKTAYDSGCVDPICLEALCGLLVQTDRLDAALSVARRWVEVDPNDAQARRRLQAMEDAGLAADGRSGPTSAGGGPIRVDQPASSGGVTPPGLRRPAAAQRSASESVD